MTQEERVLAEKKQITAARTKQHENEKHPGMKAEKNVPLWLSNTWLVVRWRKIHSSSRTSAQVARTVFDCHLQRAMNAILECVRPSFIPTTGEYAPDVYTLRSQNYCAHARSSPAGIFRSTSQPWGDTHIGWVCEPQPLLPVRCSRYVLVLLEYQ